MLDEARLLSDDSDYMGPEHLTFFRQLLTTKKQELSSRISEHEHTLSSSERVSDASDAGTLEEGRMLMTRLLQNERAEYAEINAALSRIDDGTYGWCEDLGEPIGLKRLQTRPTATRSIEAQSRFERLGRHVRAEAVSHF